MKILIASPFLVYPDTNGAKARILAFMKRLTRDGHEVHFAYMGIDKADPARCASCMEGSCASFTDLRDESYPWAEPSDDGYEIDDWVSQKQVDEFRELHDMLSPDVTIVNYIFFSKLLDGLSSVKVIDLHDRLARAEQYEAISEPPKFFYTTKEKELEGVARADIALCIQDREKPYFEQSGIPIYTFGHILPRLYLDRRFTQLKTVGYLGAYNIFNIHALRELLPAFAEFSKEHPDVRLKIGGGICNAVEGDWPFLDLAGFVPTITGFYKQIDLAINPTIAGTGLKIKTVEALAHGMPLLSTRTGMDGLPLLTEMHDAPDIETQINHLRAVKEREFNELTKLSNLAKVAHTEYTATQNATISSFLAYCGALASGQGVESPDTSTRVVGISDIKPLKSKTRMLHVLNPFHATPKSDNYLAQPITFTSMSDAIDFARDYVNVDVLNVHMPDEEPVQHPVFTHTMQLTRSSKEILPDYPRNLPLLADILEKASAHKESEWIIYTNVDIALTPGFYRRILEYIGKGHDAIVINRRTISKHISAIDQIGEAYGQIGKKHPGFDCFVFRRDLIEKMDLFDTLVGVHLIGRMLIWNLLRHASSVFVEKEEHLTFHIGDDVPSKDFSEIDIITHNFGQARKFWEKVQIDDGGVEQIEAAGVAAGVADARNFGLGQLMTPKVHTQTSGISPSTPVHFHGHFRCGSTFLFRNLRKDNGNMCFYEPFHEDIETFSQGNLEKKRELHKPANFHKEHDGEWFFKESEAILFREGKIPHFEASFGTELFGDNSPNPNIESYINMLVDTAYAEGRRPVLQFNRSGLRMEYFKRTFSDHAHFFMLRDLEDQWTSYLRFTQKGQRGFLRSMLACIGRGRKGDRLSPLADILPLYQLDSDKNLHQRYNSIFDLYTLEQLYAAFYYIWMVSALDAATQGISIIQMSEIRRNPKLQALTDEKMIQLGLSINWMQLSTDTYKDTSINPDMKHRIESVINAKLMRMYDEGTYAALAADNLGHITDSVLNNSIPDTEIQAILQASTSVDSYQDHFLAGDAARALRKLEEEQPRLLALISQPQNLFALSIGENKLFADNGGLEDTLKKSIGFSSVEKTHVWTISKQSAFAVRLPFPTQQLHCKIKLASSQPLLDMNALFSIEVNNMKLYQGYCKDWHTFEFTVPSSVLLAGRNGSLTFVFDAKNHLDETIENRTLYFAISEIEILVLPKT